VDAGVSVRATYGILQKPAGLLVLEESMAPRGISVTKEKHRESRAHNGSTRERSGSGEQSAEKTRAATYGVCITPGLLGGGGR